MADYIEVFVKAGADVKEVVGATGNVKELTDTLKDYITTADDVSGTKAKIAIDTTIKGLGRISEVLDVVEELSPELKKVEKEIAKITRTSRASLTSVRQRLRSERQTLNALNQTSEGYKRQQQTVNTLARAERYLAGIRDGSVASYQVELKALQDLGRTQNLSLKDRQALNQQISQTSEALRRASGIQANSTAELKAQRAELVANAELVAIGGKRYKEYGRQIEEIDRKLQGGSKTFRQFFAVLNRIATLQAGLTAIGAFSGAIGGLVNQFTGRTKQVENFELAIRNVGFSLGETQAFFKQAEATATALGAPITQVEQAYKRMIPALQSVGIGADESNQFIEALASRTQVLGLSSEQSGRLVEAFAQVLSKGKLQAEELNQQISEVDGAFRSQFAQALGITTAQLSELTAQGGVLSTDFVKNFLKMENGVEALRARVQSGTLTIQQLQNTISTINTKTLENIGKAIEPALRELLKIQLAIQELAKDFSESRFGQVLAKSFNDIIAGLSDFFKILTTIGKALGVVLQPLANFFAIFQAPLGPLGSLLQVMVTVVASLLTLKVALAVTAGLLGKFNALIGQQTGRMGLLTRGVLRYVSAVRSLLFLDLGSFLKKVNQGTTLFARSVASASQQTGNFSSKLAVFRNAIIRSNGSLTRFTKILAVGFNKEGGAFSRTLSNSSKGFIELGNRTRKASLATAALDLIIGRTSTTAEGSNSIFSRLGDVITGNSDKVVTAGARFNRFETATRNAKASIIKFSRANGGLGKGLSAIGVAAGKAALKVGLKAAGLAVLGAAIDVAASAIFNYLDVQKQFGEPVNKLTAELRAQGIEVQKNTGLWENLGKAIGFVLDLGGLISGINNSIRQQFIDTKIYVELASVLRQVEDRLKSYGLAYDEVTGKIRFNLKDQNKGIAALRSAAAATDEVIAAIDKEIAAKQAEERVDKNGIKRLQDRRKELVEVSSGYKLLIRNVAQSEKAIQTEIEATDDLIERLQKVKQLKAEQRQGIDQRVQKESVKIQEQFIKGLISEEKQVASISFTRAQGNIQILNTYKQQVDILQDVAKNAKNATELNEAQLAIEQLQNEFIEKRQKINEELIQARKDILAYLDAETDKAKGLNDIYNQTVSVLGDVADNVASSITEGIRAISEGIKEQAAIEFAFTGDESALRRAEQVRSKLRDMEFELEQVKLATQKIIETSRLRVLAAESRILAAKARSQGDMGEAQALENQAQLIAATIPILEKAYDVRQNILGTQRSQYQQNENLRRQLLGLPPIYKNVQQVSTSTWEKQAEQLPGLAQQYKNISRVQAELASNAATAFEQSANSIAQSFDDVEPVLQNLAKSILEASTKIEKAFSGINIEKNIAKQITALSDQIKGYQEELDKTDSSHFTGEREKITNQEPWNNLQKAIKGVNDELDKLEKPRRIKVPTPKNDPVLGFNARWMGGPVQAGQQYLVNDGGGREGFLDRFNNFKMLPPGRDISWTPSTSGTVIPADLVDRFKQNSQAEKISRSAVEPRRSTGMRGVNASLDSGNLVKQISTAMSGSGGTQRITNNVTIQSQSPVNDAAQIMANVNRLRHRRRSVL